MTAGIYRNSDHPSLVEPWRQRTEKISVGGGRVTFRYGRLTRRVPPKPSDWACERRMRVSEPLPTFAGVGTRSI